MYPYKHFDILEFLKSAYNAPHNPCKSKEAILYHYLQKSAVFCFHGFYCMTGTLDAQYLILSSYVYGEVTENMGAEKTCLKNYKLCVFSGLFRVEIGNFFSIFGI
mmetsp:Transcript_19663/g.30226  ORF Transcript_19663/g.30226 Transcript_19663/m.30226 type:complete len:105 (+) Transcript_19663:303-617(+)